MSLSKGESTTSELQHATATPQDIDELLVNFCEEYRKKLEKAYDIIGDDQPRGTMIIPKLVLQHAAEAFSLPPSMDKQIRGIKKQLDAML